uniref:Uncharacterized protein n=1 Tax=Arundo donax TaxID=35708 RepID=A0A0A8ZB31_ARUDO
MVFTCSHLIWLDLRMAVVSSTWGRMRVLSLMT